MIAAAAFSASVRAACARVSEAVASAVDELGAASSCAAELGAASCAAYFFWSRATSSASRPAYLARSVSTSDSFVGLHFS